MHQKLRYIAYFVITAMLLLHLAQIPLILGNRHPELDYLWVLEMGFILLFPVLFVYLRQSHRSLEEERYIFDEAIDSLPGIFYLFKQDGQMIRWNRSFETVSGYSHDEIMDRNPLSYFSDPDRSLVAEAIQTAFTEGETQLEANFIRKDGRQIPYLFSAKRLALQENVYLIGLGIDISDLKAAQAEARRVDQLELALMQSRQAAELKNRFMTLVSHEFRTPLTVIQNAAQIMEHYWSRLTPNKRIKHLQNILQHVREIDNLLDDFSTVQKINTTYGAFSIDSFSVVEVCREVIDSLQNEQDAAQTIHLIEQIDNPTVTLNRRLLIYVLHNLLDNAMKYSPAGSVIQCRLRKQDEQLIIEIEDEGLGISSNDQKNIFQAFYRGEKAGQNRGTGLGLKIVQDSVQAMRGEITVTSHIGKGSVFQVRLPDSSVDRPNSE